MLGGVMNTVVSFGCQQGSFAHQNVSISLFYTMLYCCFEFMHFPVMYNLHLNIYTCLCYFPLLIHSYVLPKLFTIDFIVYYNYPSTFYLSFRILSVMCMLYNALSISHSGTKKCSLWHVKLLSANNPTMQCITFEAQNCQ